MEKKAIPKKWQNKNKEKCAEYTRTYKKNLRKKAESGGEHAVQKLLERKKRSRQWEKSPSGKVCRHVYAHNAWVKLKADKDKHEAHKISARPRDHKRYMINRNDPNYMARKRHLYRMSYAVQKLMRDLSGVIEPRHIIHRNCTNRCRQTYYETDNRRVRAWNYKRWCTMCCAICNESVCLCCRSKTRNLFNVSAHKRELWSIAEDVELHMLVHDLFKHTEPEQITITIQPYRRGNESTA